MRCDSTTQAVNVKTHMFAQVALFCEGITLVFTMWQASDFMNAFTVSVSDRITIDLPRVVYTLFITVNMAMDARMEAMEAGSCSMLQIFLVKCWYAVWRMYQH